MINFSSLKTLIDTSIRANGNQEITGPVLNSVLTQILNQVGGGTLSAMLAIGQTVNLRSVSNGEFIGVLSIIKGHHYTVTNRGSAGASVRSMLGDGTYVEVFGTVNPGYSLSFTATQDADYVGGYSGSPWNVDWIDDTNLLRWIAMLRGQDSWFSGDHFNSFLFENGNIETDGTNGTYEQTKRARMWEILRAESDLVLEADSNVNLVVNYYDSEGVGTNVEPGGWKKYTTIQKGSYFRVLLRNVTSGTLTVEQMVNSVTALRGDKCYIQGAQPPVIYQSREGSVTSTAVPPNSKWSIAMCARNEYDRVRITIRKTSDGEFICCHDTFINNVARNLDGTAISSQIVVADSTLETLDGYDWGIQYGQRYRGFRTPRFADALYYANLFNLGISIEFNWTLTDADVAAIYSILVKYNALRDLIVIGGGSAQKFPLVDKRINVYVGGVMSDLRLWVNYINEYKTGENKIYVQLYPMGTIPTSEFLTLCAENEWIPYVSNIFSKNDLLSFGWNCGVGLYEAQNVGLIKTTIRKYGESQF